MNNAIKTILVAILLCSASILAAAQPVNSLFFKIEDRLRQKESGWTMMNRWLGPQGQAVGFLWRQDHEEIFAWIVLEPSIGDAIHYFADDGLGHAAAKTERHHLRLGDECYWRQSGPHAAAVLRKDNVLVRLGSKTSTPEVLVVFAQHISPRFLKKTLEEATRKTLAKKR